MSQLPPQLVKLMKPGLGFKHIKPSDYDFNAWNGRLLLWKAREDGASYALGVDPSGGVGADRGVIEVIKLGTLNYPDEQVAEFASDFHGPQELSGIIDVLGKYYASDDGTEALVIVECNTDGGETCQLDLRMRYGYNNLYIWKVYDRMNNLLTNKLGWWTTKTNRLKLIDRALYAISRGDLIINSPYLLSEMADFERDHFLAKAKARIGTHDDRVMGLLIAYWGGHDDEWLAGEDIGEQRRLLTKAKERQYAVQEHSSNPGVRMSYQTSTVSYEKMMQHWNDSFYDD